jgi:hypothetical protein
VLEHPVLDGAAVGVGEPGALGVVRALGQHRPLEDGDAVDRQAVGAGDVVGRLAAADARLDLAR